MRQEKVLVLCACLIGILISGCSSKSLYTEGSPEGYSFVDQVSQIRVALPDEVMDHQLDISDVTISGDADSLENLISNQYCTRQENYGMITIGPDLYFLTARDKNLFNKDLRTISYPGEIQYILQDEVELDQSIYVTDQIEKQTNEAGDITKVICPVTVSSFFFDDVEFTQPCTGYASLIQKENLLSAISLSVHVPREDKDLEQSLMDRDYLIMKSFQFNDIDEFDPSTNYNTYSNILPNCSYDKGGLFNYDHASYYYQGTEKLDAEGTYNSISENIGMYCFNTYEYGPINMPYILSDEMLTSHLVQTVDGIEASISSKTDKIAFDIDVKSHENREAIFAEILDELRNRVRSEKERMKDDYQNQKIVSEQITENEEAIITVCGWNPDSGENITVYYKMICNNQLHEVTKISVIRNSMGETVPMLDEITGISGIALV